MDFNTPQFWVAILQIIWIDLLLSGDNAIVIALACRQLPERQRKVGILLGSAVAIGLRIVFAIGITYLLALPLLKLIGGLLLLWIAVKLAIGEEEHTGDIEASDNLWRAVRTIAIADAVMSLDNVVAISAASHGDIRLFIFGLLLSIPLIMFGASVITGVIQRYPIVVWAGAALLGWIAGDMIINDPVMLSQLRAIDPGLVVVEASAPTGFGAAPVPDYAAQIGCAALVLAIARFVRRGRPQTESIRSTTLP